ncbi:MAG TPA: ATP-binding protein [Pyrinomonadaceae bacterium]
MTAGMKEDAAAMLDAPPAPEKTGLLDAVLARMRPLAARRLLWLESLAGAGAAAEYASLPPRLRVALLDLDAPEEEARFYRRDARCRELSAQADTCADAIADSPDNAFRHVIEVLGATPPEADLLQVCLAAHLDPSLAQIYGYLEGDVARRSYATEALAARLCGYGRASLWSPAGALARWQVLEADASEPGESPPLRVDPYIVQFLQGSMEIDAELLGCASYVEPRTPLPRWPVEELSRRIVETVRRGSPNRIWLVGQRLSGRRTLAACVARRLGSDVVAVDTSRIGEASWSRAQVRIRRHALLHGCAVAWHGAQVLRAASAGGEMKLPLEFAVLEPPGETPAEPGWREERVEMPRLLSHERARLWEQFLPASKLWTEDERRPLAERYLLQVGEIAHVAAQSPESFNDVRRLAREFSRGRLDDLGHLLDCPFRREDLQLPERLGRIIDEFLFEARDRIRFWENEGVRRLFPRGTGLIGLMSGPPGTGKTMAAQVIAAELELDLYRIDLASTVNKYIGETAKNLRRLFARAADMNAVLLFDEADALFSKRTEVRDSHDRYANADTNYLLQLIEDYPGVALLATNKRQNMDEAFVRRVRYLLFFPKPDAAQRLAIWRQVVRELAGEQCEQALAKELAHAAERVEATGAQIKNATLAAMFLARQAGRPLGSEELRRGLERELSNQGGTASFESDDRGGRR